MKKRASYDMTVKIEDLQTAQESVFYLVRVEEEHPEERKISMYDPVGKALFTKTIDDVVEIVQKDGSARKFKIKDIEPT